MEQHKDAKKRTSGSELAGVCIAQFQLNSYNVSPTLKLSIRTYQEHTILLFKHTAPCYIVKTEESRACIIEESGIWDMVIMVGK